MFQIELPSASPQGLGGSPIESNKRHGPRIAISRVSWLPNGFLSLSGPKSLTGFRRAAPEVRITLCGSKEGFSTEDSHQKRQVRNKTTAFARGFSSGMRHNKPEQALPLGDSHRQHTSGWHQASLETSTGFRRAGPCVSITPFGSKE